jgi:hypothetical protein
VIRRYDMRRSDNFPLSGTISTVILTERMFFVVGFELKSAIATSVSGHILEVDGLEGNGFYVKFSPSSVGEVARFQYMVS